jgi:DNA-binding transcriptional MerR regulator
VASAFILALDRNSDRNSDRNATEKTMEQDTLLKIGQLARQTGLTVRTLHHYDAIGLLTPSGRAENGYRLYNRADIARLHQVQALRRLGLSLEDSGAVLAGKDSDIATLVARQVAQLNEQIEHATLLRDRLLGLQEDFAARAEPDLKEWLTTLELMAIFDKHLTPEESARWREHKRAGQRKDGDAWRALVTHIHGLIGAGVPADAPAAQESAHQWLQLTDPHIKHNPQLMLKLDTAYREDPAIQAVMGTDRALVDYVSLAAAHYRLGLYARHLTAAQLASIRPRYLTQTGGAVIALSYEMRTLMEDGAAAGDAAVLALCARWRALFETYFGSDPDVRARVLHAQASDPALALGSTWDPALRAYLRAGLAQLDALEVSHV